MGGLDTAIPWCVLTLALGKPYPRSRSARQVYAKLLAGYTLHLLYCDWQVI